MKSRILLIDDSLTVQKVVSLTLDKNSTQVFYAKGRMDAVKQLQEHAPHLVLLSDQVKDLTAQTFPKEVEAWLGRDHNLPAMVLITGQDIKEMRHFSAILKKPFSPQALLEVVGKFAKPKPEERSVTAGIDAALGMGKPAQSEEYEEERLERAFNEHFNDEKTLVMQTLGDIPEHEEDNEPTLLNIVPGGPARKQQHTEPSYRMETPSELWGVSKNVKGAPESPLLGAEDSMAYKASLENKVRNELEGRDLDAVVDRMLNHILPPIVERLVQERLDKLLNDQEKLVNPS